jgi:sulfopyruvate decarboxylase TPP-binding subunit
MPTVVSAARATDSTPMAPLPVAARTATVTMTDSGVGNFQNLICALLSGSRLPGSCDKIGPTVSAWAMDSGF